MTARWSISILGLCGLLTGCHSDQVATYPTSGTVMFVDGQPVKTGVIELESIQDHTTATGAIREDGSFVVGTYSSTDGAAAGKHRVIVIQFVVSDGLVKHKKDHGQAVPTKYARYETSGLTLEVLSHRKNLLDLKLDRAK